MENNIIIVEGLRLSDINPGNYQFCAMPLVVKGADRASARAFLLEKH